MKKILVAAFAAAAVSAYPQVIIYDTITGVASASVSTDVPRSRIADGLSTLAAPAGLQWSVSKIEVVLFVSKKQNYQLNAAVNVWNTWDPGAAAGSVFSNLAKAKAWSLGSFNPATAPSSATFTLDYAAAGETFLLGSGQNMGIEIQWTNNTTETDNLSTGLADTLPSAGSSTNLFYRDANSNDIMEQSEGSAVAGWTNTNALYRVTATAVPEPASIAVLGLGLAALLARRRKKA